MEENENQMNQENSESRYYSNLEPHPDEYIKEQNNTMQNGYGQESYNQSPYTQNEYQQGSYGQTSYTQNGYNQGNYYRQNGAREKDHGKGFAIASLVLGILSILCFCACVNFIMGIAALVLGIIHLVRSDEGKGMAIAGIVLSVISMVAGGIFWVFVIANMDLSDINSSNSFYIEDFGNGSDDYYDDDPYVDEDDTFHIDEYDDDDTF